MALGVLNNLSAIYAENNLNNTNSSLQTVLQQLSSGSRINSGADDAAGLSLVNGLGANSAALTQSETNATEDVYKRQQCLHAVDGPEEIDGRGAGCGQLGTDAFELRSKLLRSFGFGLLRAQRHAVGCGDADGRRAAHHHGDNDVGHLFVG